MELQEFIVKFAEQFDETEASDFNEDTKFKELDDWSSMVALMVIAMADDEFGVTINADDIENSETIRDLYNYAQKNVPEV